MLLVNNTRPTLVVLFFKIFIVLSRTVAAFIDSRRLRLIGVANVVDGITAYLLKGGGVLERASETGRELPCLYASLLVYS